MQAKALADIRDKDETTLTKIAVTPYFLIEKIGITAPATQSAEPDSDMLHLSRRYIA